MRCFRSENGGFTLIEMAIVLIVSGLLLSLSMPMLVTQSMQQNKRVTLERLSQAEQALKRFYDMNGYYPCPAPRDAQSGAAAFGKAVDVCKKDDHAISASSDIGMPVAEGRDQQRVRIGILPFRSLGMRDAEAVDAWGALLHYAVTESLTDIKTFNPRNGGIDVIADDEQSRVVPPGTVQFVIASSGPNGHGGYTATGGLLSECPHYPLLESENCDDDAVFMDAESQISREGSGAGPGGSEVSYDDLLRYEQYDPLMHSRGGLTFLFEESCTQGFTEVLVDKSRIAGVEVLRQKMGNMSAPDPKKLKLCSTTRYSTTLMMETRKSDEDVDACPMGWVNIGYREYGAGDSSLRYKVCAR